MSSNSAARVTAGTALLLALVALATGCATSKQESPPKSHASYTPMTTTQMRSEIEALPHVTRVRLVYSDTFGSTNNYTAMVYVDETAEKDRVLDDAVAIVWQGHYRASLSMQVVGPPPTNDTVFNDDLGLSTYAQLRARYGTQPGDGKPPSTPLKATQS